MCQLEAKKTRLKKNSSSRRKGKPKLHPAEALKRKKNGLDVLTDIPYYVRNGWESIPDTERDRLKYVGVFYRRQTPGAFMMRLRMSSGFPILTSFGPLPQ